MDIFLFRRPTKYYIVLTDASGNPFRVFTKDIPASTMEVWEFVKHVFDMLDEYEHVFGRTQRVILDLRTLEQDLPPQLVEELNSLPLGE